MYLWQPIAGSFYAPCVDGDYDMTVIGHEYTHAITNRMIAGPNAGLSSPQGMSESWSDLLAMEYLFEYGYAPPGTRAFTIGAYVTGDPVAGIRNYNMSRSPLNYSTSTTTSWACRCTPTARCGGPPTSTSARRS